MGLASLYILHFDKAHHHAAHYAGSTEHLIDRLDAHANGRAARLTEVIANMEIGWTLAGVYVLDDIGKMIDKLRPGYIRRLEAELKRQKRNKRYCQLCRPENYQCPAGTIDYPAPRLTSKELKNEDQR